MHKCLRAWDAYIQIDPYPRDVYSNSMGNSIRSTWHDEALIAAIVFVKDNAGGV